MKTLGSTSLGGHPVPQMCLTCSPFPKARFLTGTDKALGSSTSSDTEEDALPSNKCKKVRGPLQRQVHGFQEVGCTGT